VADPRPPLAVLQDSEAEAPPPPKQRPGAAQPESVTIMAPKILPSPLNEPIKGISEHRRRVQPEPKVDVYPKARPRPHQPATVAYPVATTHPPAYRAVRRSAPTVRQPVYQARPASVRPQQPRPQLPNHQNPLPNLRPPTYPTAGRPMASCRPTDNWNAEHRRLKDQYLQTRADALNIKYNRGRPHFSPHSPSVILSASAPPLPRPGVRAPWDKLGQAFDRSEAARRDLQAFEQTRYSPTVPRPNIPAPPRPYGSGMYP
jgi:hypothetical protein